MAHLPYHSTVIPSNVIDLATRRALRGPRDPRPPVAPAASGAIIVQIDAHRDPQVTELRSATKLALDELLALAGLQEGIDLLRTTSLSEVA
jgi:hypothetical protein